MTSRSEISDLEHERNSPTLDKLIRIVVALDVSGQTDAEKLSRFFLGPDGQRSWQDALESLRPYFDPPEASPKRGRRR